MDHIDAGVHVDDCSFNALKRFACMLKFYPARRVSGVHMLGLGTGVGNI